MKWSGTVEAVAGWITLAVAVGLFLGAIGTWWWLVSWFLTLWGMAGITESDQDYTPGTEG